MRLLAGAALALGGETRGPSLVNASCSSSTRRLRTRDRDGSTTRAKHRSCCDHAGARVDRASAPPRFNSFAVGSRIARRAPDLSGCPGCPSAGHQAPLGRESDAQLTSVGIFPCVWNRSLPPGNRSLPPDFATVTEQLKDPDTRVQLIVCAKDAAEAEAFGATPIVIPPLDQRARELPRIVEEYGYDATEALGVPRTDFLREDRDWVTENAAESLPDIEKATLRLLAIREARGNMNRAAARLGMGRWSLSKWARRRKLPISTDDADT